MSLFGGDRSRPGQRRALLLLTTTGLLLLLSAAVASAASSIEGVWSFGGGQIAVHPGPEGTFVGTVVVATQFAECVHPVDQEIWKDMRPQADGSYWGGHQWYFEGTCAENPEPGATAWRVMEEPNGSRYLRACFSEPGSSQPTIAPNGSDAHATYDCVNSTLVAALPTASVLSFGATKCASARHFQIHLREPRYDPFKTVRITLAGHKLTARRRGDYVVATINLEGRPPGSFTVKIAATTVLGMRLMGSRTYHTCAKTPRRHRPGRLEPVKSPKHL
jgi:hypothetical protein